MKTENALLYGILWFVVLMMFYINSVPASNTTSVAKIITNKPNNIMQEDPNKVAASDEINVAEEGTELASEEVINDEIMGADESESVVPDDEPVNDEIDEELPASPTSHEGSFDS